MIGASIYLPAAVAVMASVILHPCVLGSHGILEVTLLDDAIEI